MKNKMTFGVITFLLVLGNAVAKEPANEVIHNGLSIINVSKTVEEQDPLKSVATIHFPSNIKNIGQALNYVLLRTGFTLFSKDQMEHQVKKLMSLKLPAIQKTLKSLTVSKMIEILIGKGYQFSVDDLNRQIIVTTSMGSEPFTVQNTSN